MSRAGAVEETGGEEGIGEEDTLEKINTQNGGKIFLQSRAAQGWDQSQRKKNHARSKAIGREEKKNLRDDIFLRHGVQQEEAVCEQEIRSLRVEKKSSDWAVVDRNAEKIFLPCVDED
jgi:hypothetical protein